MSEWIKVEERLPRLFGLYGAQRMVVFCGDGDRYDAILSWYRLYDNLHYSFFEYPLNRTWHGDFPKGIKPLTKVSHWLEFPLQLEFLNEETWKDLKEVLEICPSPMRCICEKIYTTDSSRRYKKYLEEVVKENITSDEWIDLMMLNARIAEDDARLHTIDLTKYERLFPDPMGIPSADTIQCPCNETKINMKAEVKEKVDGSSNE